MIRNLTRISSIKTFTKGFRTNYFSTETDKLPVTFEDVIRAYHRIESGVRRTHLDRSPFLSEICETEVYLKKEFTQFTGSFKERGARNSLMLLSPEAKKVRLLNGDKPKENIIFISNILFLYRLGSLQLPQAIML